MPGLWVKSCEHEEAITEICELCDDVDRQWPLAVFDVDEGLAILTETTRPNPETGIEETVNQLVPGFFEVVEHDSGDVTYKEHSGVRMKKLDLAIKSLPGMNEGVEGPGGEPPNAIMVLKNAHLLIKNPGMIQLLANVLYRDRDKGRHIIVLSPVVDIPLELKKLFESGIIEHKLPDREQLRAVLKTTAPRDSDTPECVESILDAALGLTRFEAEGAFALSLTSDGIVIPKSVFNIKANALQSTAGLSLHEGGEKFDDIGGLDFMKRYCLELLADRDPNPKFRAVGVLIMGVSGGGKSLFAKALGAETNRPTLCFDMAATMGSLMGQSQQQFRAALDKAEAMAPCIVFGDEVEKMLAGAGDDSKTSGGVKTDMFGHLLTRMQDSTADVFYVFTCNDIRVLSDKFPEFLGRFDDLFFVDYPSEEARQRIWEIHLKGYEHIPQDADFAQRLGDGAVALPNDDGWTGREIEKCCRQAKLRHLTVAAVGRTMPRLADQATGTIEALRTWATGRCYAAEYEDLYDPKQHGSRLKGLLATMPLVTGSNGGPRRKIRRKIPKPDPGDN